jgi:hypothetical protein
VVATKKFWTEKLGGLCLLDGAARDVLRSFATPREVEREVLTGEDDSPDAQLIQQLALRRFLYH